jgi:hypothetical protein
MGPKAQCLQFVYFEKVTGKKIALNHADRTPRLELLMQ